MGMGMRMGMVKEKKFFSALSLQPKLEDHQLTNYTLDSSCGDMLNMKTRNPIMPFLLSQVEAGDTITLYLISCEGNGEVRFTEKDEDTGEIKKLTKAAKDVSEMHRQNYESELEQIKKEVGDFNSKVEVIPVVGLSNEVCHKLLRDIISKINDHDVVFMDVTFGFKPVTIIQFLALTYAYKLRKNVEIGALSYGSLYGTASPGAFLFNLTEFFLLCNTMNNMSDIPNADKFIDQLLDNMIGEDETK